MRQLADELARALGPDKVEISRGSRSTPRRIESRPQARKAPAEAAAPLPSSGAAFSEQAILSAMNRERASRGLGALRINRQLSLAAGDRIEDMFSKSYFDHVDPNGMSPFVWAQRRGYAYRAIGENLATGYRSSGAVVDGWMHSPGHRANILGRDFNEVGLALAPGSPTGRYSGPTVVALYASR